MERSSSADLPIIPSVHIIPSHGLSIKSCRKSPKVPSYHSYDSAIFLKYDKSHKTYPSHIISQNKILYFSIVLLLFFFLYYDIILITI